MKSIKPVMFALLVPFAVLPGHAEVANLPALMKTKQTTDNLTVKHTDRIRHMLNRTTFGATPALIQEVQQGGIDDYLKAQLNYKDIDDQFVESKLKDFVTIGLDSKTLIHAYYDRIRRFISNQQMNDNLSAEARLHYGFDRFSQATNQADAKPNTQQEQLEELLQRLDFQAMGELQNAKIIRAVHSKRQLFEVMVDFWSNHFNIDIKKGASGPLKIVDDREVIRVHALGNFKDLIIASAHSPAMLSYLDNNQNSVRRKISWVEKKIRNRATHYLLGVDAASIDANGDAKGYIGGLNENYGRELLELHSLGVDGGYTQQDVLEVSRAFTGWTYSPFNGSFTFNRTNHDKGKKRVLGINLNSSGVKEGKQVLDIIAAHPGTARHLAFKLCQRFVNDIPPEELVAEVADTFLQAEGDIPSTLLAIFNSDWFFHSSNVDSKLKSPFEFAISSLRLLDADVYVEEQLVIRNVRMILEGLGSAGYVAEVLSNTRQKSVNWRLVEMGQPLFAYPAPTGYPEDSKYWQQPGLAIARMNFALALLNEEITGVRLNQSSLDLRGFIDISPGLFAEEWDESLTLAAAIASPSFQYH